METKPSSVQDVREEFKKLASMIIECKVCKNPIPVTQLGEDWACTKCQHYGINCDEHGIVESEAIRTNNFYLIYMPPYKTANICSTGDNNKIVLKQIDMNELTHEQAVQWVNKLKTYVLFQ